MKRGFIFSVDAAMALIVVMAMAAMLIVYFQAAEQKTDAYASSNRVAGDATVVGPYLDKDAGEIGLASDLPFAEFASCGITYEYGEIHVDGSRSALVEKKYCEGIG